MYNPLNNADNATTKYILFRCSEYACNDIIFDKIIVIVIISVITIREIKLGRYGSVSLVILFLLIIYFKNHGTAIDLNIIVSRSMNTRLTILISINSMKLTPNNNKP